MKRFEKGNEFTFAIRETIVGVVEFPGATFVGTNETSFPKRSVKEIHFGGENE